MRASLQSHVHNLRNAWDGGLREEVRRSSMAFFILWLIAFAACAFLPELRTALAERMLSALNGLNVTDETGSLSALALFLNNVRASTAIMLYGLIPFVQLTALALGINAMLLGVMASWYLAEGISLPVYFSALLPHGIFEFPALFLAFGMGLYICGQLTRRCRGDRSAHGLWNCLVLASQMLFLVLIPLLAAAALAEAYVTPAVISLFL